jgi:hypothetical protein
MRSAFVSVLMSGLAVVAPNANGWRDDSFQAPTRTIYISALDKDGLPVSDLQAVEIELKVGGKTQRIVSAAEATLPLRVSILDADQGTGAFQQGIARFMQTLLGHAEFALTSVIVQPQKITDYSGDARVLSDGVSRLGQRGRERGAQLLEAIQEAARSVRRENRRPVILVLRLGGEGVTSLQGKDVLEDVRKSGAILYAVSSAGAQGRAPNQNPNPDETNPDRARVNAQQGQLRDDELADSMQHLGTVLGDGVKESGGRHDQVIATTHAQAIQRIANELRHQYEVTFEMSESVKPGDKLAVSTKRKGVTLRAPSRIAN